MKSKTRIIPALVLVLFTVGTPLTQQSRPAQYSLAIPIDVTSYGGIFLQARVNNSQPLSFYLDSGASFPFVIGTNKATALGLKLDEQFLMGGGAGPNMAVVSKTNGLTIALTNTTFTNQRAAVLDLRTIEEQLGRPLDGLVGVELFLKYVVEIDYASRLLRLYDPQSYVFSGNGESVPLALRDGHFFVPATIDIPQRGEIAGQFLVDTGGCMMTTILTTGFARRHTLPVSAQKTIVDRSVAGLGGQTRLLVSRASSFKIGSAVFSAPLIYLSQDKGGALASSEFDGLIGTEILKRFKLIFDYSRQRLILERNARFSEPLEYDMTGMNLRAYGDAFRVFKIHQVLENSPAREAGLNVGDTVEAIDSIPASQLTLEQILQMMKVPDHEYQLTVKSGTGLRTVKIKTRRLI